MIFKSILGRYVSLPTLKTCDWGIIQTMKRHYFPLWPLLGHGINLTSKFTINFGEWFVFQIPFWSFGVCGSLLHPLMPLFRPTRCNLQVFGFFCRESFVSLVLRVNSACLSSAFFLAYHYLLNSTVVRKVYFELSYVSTFWKISWNKIFLLYIPSTMAKDKKKPKEDKSMKGASSSQKKEKAPAVARSRSVASTRTRVDEYSGSGKHRSRPHTSGTPGRASADPVSAFPIRQRTGDSSKDILPPQSNLLLPVRSDGESSDETVAGYFVSTEMSVK